MTAKIFRNSFLIGITVLLVSSVLFFAVMFSNYENQAFERLSAEAESISLALDRSGLSYLESLRASDRVTLIAPDGSVLDPSSSAYIANGSGAVVGGNTYCVIVTGDRDSLQLVGEHVTVLLAATKMGRPETTVYDPAAIQEKYNA